MSRRRVPRTARADEDIERIAKWIARDSLDASLEWLTELDKRLLVAAENPGGGTRREDLRPDLRMWVFDDYLLFYKPTKNGILLLRVIHGARDYTRFFRRG